VALREPRDEVDLAQVALAIAESCATATLETIDRDGRTRPSERGVDLGLGD
jgi:hypothetical protein